MGELGPLCPGQPGKGEGHVDRGHSEEGDVMSSFEVGKRYRLCPTCFAAYGDDGRCPAGCPLPAPVPGGAVLRVVDVDRERGVVTIGSGSS
jgi:hypothetical protein